MKRFSLIHVRALHLLTLCLLWYVTTGCKKESSTVVPPKEQQPNPDPDQEQPETIVGREITVVPDAYGTLVIDNSNGKYQPGDILNLKGDFKGILISNMSGNPSKPIYVRNFGTTVTNIGDPKWNGGSWAAALTFSNCHYIKIGSTNSRTQFVVNGSEQGNRGAYFNVVLKDKTDNFEMRNMIIRNGGTGIWAKTDPVKNDASTYYPNSWMSQLSIHNLTVSGTLNEAMYIGHTATYWNLTSNMPYFGSPSEMPGGNQFVQPIKWRGVKIYANLVMNSGADGIQTAAIDQLEVYNNNVSNWGTQRNPSHCGGILIGGRTTNSNVHDNYVHDGWGELCQFFGSGENGGTHIIRNNLFRDNTGSDGVSLRGTQDARVQVLNNTIARTAGVNLRINGYQGMTSKVLVQSNAFIQPMVAGGAVNTKAYIYSENGGDYTEGTGNLFNAKFATVLAALVDANNYYMPNSGSPMQGAGYRK